MRTITGLAELKQAEGQDLGTSDWHDVTQEAIDAFAAEIESQSTALYATARLWDDGIIDPRDTRTVLGIALSAVHTNVVEGTRSYGVFRM